MKVVEIRTKSGLYLGKVTQIEPTGEDWRRFRNVLDKYTKGLVFHELGAILPTEYKIKHCIFLTEEHTSDIMVRTKELKWNTDNDGIFIYGFNFIQGTHKSIWITIFYNSVLCESLVYTERDLMKLGRGTSSDSQCIPRNRTR